MRYAIALLGYVAIGFLTKSFLSSTWGLIYFVTAVEIVPSLLRRLRAPGEAPDQPTADSAVEP